MARQKQGLESEDTQQKEEVTINETKANTQIDTDTLNLPADTSTMDSHTLGILKTFSGYEALYIDKLGGVYVPDTPQQLRGNAKLITNPFHKR